MSNQPPKSSLSALERHVQTILVSLIAAAIIWGAVKLTEYQSQMVRFEERMIALTEKIDSVTIMRADVEDLKIRMRVLETQTQRNSQP